MNKTTISYRFDVLRGGVFYKTLRAELSGDVMCSADAIVKRSVSCSLYIPDDVDFLTDELRVLLIKDGEEYPLGIFEVTTQTRNVMDDGRAVYSIEGYDRAYLVDRKKLERRSEGHISAGTKYTDAIESLLISAGIRTSLITPSELELATDREDWDIGTSHLTIINQLLDEINYSSLWFDSNGYARSEQYQSAETKPVEFYYSAGRGSIIIQAHSLGNDYFDSYNVFTVGVSRVGEDQPIYVTAVNSDISSKISTVYRGRIAAPVVMLADVADEETAQVYADNLVLKSRISHETASVQTEVEGGHEVGSVVGVFIPQLSGKFEETAWTIPLTGDPLMSHTIRRTAYV